MFELIMIGAATVLVYRIVEMEKGASWAWSAATIGLCIGSVFVIPFPYLRILLVFILVFCTLFIIKLKKKNVF